MRTLAVLIFRRGDVNGDGTSDTTDPPSNLSYEFQDSFLPICLDAADIDDSGRVDISDPVPNRTDPFNGTLQIPAPEPLNCGSDPISDSATVGDDLACEVSHSCAH